MSGDEIDRLFAKGRQVMNLFYIGDHFYTESGTMMSPIYAEDGCRSDWGKVQIALERGDEVHIRQATDAERGHYEAILSRMKRKASSNAELSGGPAARKP